MPETWADRYPDRWRRELAALEATGWDYRVDHDDHDDSAGRGDRHEPRLEVSYPVPPDAPVGSERGRWLLTVRYPAEYPFFPPQVTTAADPGPGLGRHYNPTTRVLCLVEPGDWRLETTAAELLTGQLPRLLAANHDPAATGPAWETPAPIPIGARLAHARALPALLIPDHPPFPAHLDGGAVVVRFALDGRPEWLGTAMLEHLLAPGYRWRAGPPCEATAFPVTAIGRWLRDPDFDPTATAEANWQRLAPRLEPLEIAPEQGEAGGLPPSVAADRLELLLLLVPGEIGYRAAGEEWVALLRLHAPDGSTSTHYQATQRLGGLTRAARTPIATTIADRHVVLVGLGALGHHLAIDLARTGTGRLDLVDGGRTDLTTGSRQFTPLTSAGHPKAVVLAAGLAAAGSHTRIRGFSTHFGEPPHHHRHDVGLDDDNQAARSEHHRRALRRALATADLVIDATADTAVAGYLSALRRAQGRDYLHVSATAGGWGGVVFLATDQTGCWACLQHHRTDGAVPVPPADHSGIVAPPGCAEPTFTGTNPDLATIAHHASRVVLDHLGGGPGLGGDLYVATQRSGDGRPVPTRWRSVPVPVHPGCPLHHPPGATPPAGGAGTVTARPEERQADGDSPPRAPIPPTPQRKQPASPDGPAASAGIGAAETHSGHEGADPASPRVSAPETSLPPPDTRTTPAGARK